MNYTRFSIFCQVGYGTILFWRRKGGNGDPLVNLIDLGINIFPGGGKPRHYISSEAPVVPEM
jgi:hypothetical protein